MRFEMFTYSAVVSLAVATLALGCASSGGDDEVVETTTIEEFSDGGAGGGDPGMGGEGTRGLLESVYFDYDSAAIKSDQRSVLQGNASKIGQNAGWNMVVVEGHCDERGSEEYNLALGERRAGAVKQYLVDSGVSGAKIDTVSFGEAKPAVQGHDESAYKWNRRAEFVVNQ